jgi:septation ring formation regulator EzrA
MNVKKEKQIKLKNIFYLLIIFILILIIFLFFWGAFLQKKTGIDKNDLTKSKEIIVKESVWQ